MSYDAKVYRVMIASPSDVGSVKGVIRQVIHEWNTVHSQDKHIVLLPVSWDTDSAPSMNARPQEVINRQVLEGSDLLIGVFWTRLGTPTEKARSGTVEEITKHLEAGKPAMVYFSSEPVKLESVDKDQWEALIQFKKDMESKGLVEKFEDLQDFERKFSRQLGIKILESFTIESPPLSQNDDIELKTSNILAQLSEEAKTLLREVANDPNGIILRLRTFGGLVIQTNKKNFADQGNPRSEAAWEKAIKQLEFQHLIADRGHKREIFQLSADGYEIADFLND